LFCFLFLFPPYCVEETRKLLALLWVHPALLMLLAALLGTISLSIQGYHALTKRNWQQS
jgi:hypothetical protein